MAFHWRADDGLFIVIFGSTIPSSKKEEKKPINFEPLRENFLNPRMGE